MSYTSRTRSKNHPGVAPVVIQGYSESTGVLTYVGSPDGTWTYTFDLATADVDGDIRTVTHAHDTNDCHDSGAALAHIESNIVDGYQTCDVCHATDRMVPVSEAHLGY